MQVGGESFRGWPATRWTDCSLRVQELN